MKKENVRITNVLRNIMINMSFEQRQIIVDILLDEIKRQKEIILRQQKEQEKGILYTLQRIQEEINETTQNESISCKAGCDFCCHIFTKTTEIETKIALEAYSGEIDMARLKKQALCESEHDYRQLSYSDRRCVFLNEENKCSIYSSRPSACRKYMVKSPAEQCNTEKHPNGQVEVLVNNKAEIISTAIINVFESDTFAKQLLKFK